MPITIGGVSVSEEAQHSINRLICDVPSTWPMTAAELRNRACDAAIRLDAERPRERERGGHVTIPGISDTIRHYLVNELRRLDLTL